MRTRPILPEEHSVDGDVFAAPIWSGVVEDVSGKPPWVEALMRQLVEMPVIDARPNILRRLRGQEVVDSASATLGEIENWFRLEHVAASRSLRNRHHARIAAFVGAVEEGTGVEFLIGLSSGQRGWTLFGKTIRRIGADRYLTQG